jgi:hypothetical protein
MNVDFRRLQADPAGWTGLHDERSPWEQSLLCGLDAT